MHEQACCHDEAANHQLPTAVAFWIIWIVSMEEHSSLMQNLVQIHCSTHSVIFNMTSTQYTCSHSGVYCAHWLVQWSHHCSCMCILGHSLWLPDYIEVVQTILVILTMAGLFPNRSPIYMLKSKCLLLKQLNLLNLLCNWIFFSCPYFLFLGWVCSTAI